MSSANSINLLNLNLNDYEDICMICQENLSSAITYILPECNHKYHTHCVIAWFRNGDSRCPYCGNKGINHKQTKLKQGSRWRYWNRCHNQIKINELKKFSKTSEAPPILVKAFKKLELLNKTFEDKQQSLKDFMNNLKTDKVDYYNIKKQLQVLRTAKWKAGNAIYNQKNYIMDLHIVPLIIPIPLDIN